MTNTLGVCQTKIMFKVNHVCMTNNNASIKTYIQVQDVVRNRKYMIASNAYSSMIQQKGSRGTI